MPARIVLVHDDPKFVETAAGALEAAGFSVAVSLEPIRALNALNAAQSVELLITRILFQLGQPNGVSLALMVKSKRPKAQVIFVALPEMHEYAAGIGQFLPMPVAPARLLEEVRQLIFESRGAQPLTARVSVLRGR